MEDRLAVSFRIEVSHRQLVVFNTDLARPFSQWTEAATRQGFSWRRDSLAFMTLEDGSADIDFELVSLFAPSDASLRTISLPFACRGKVELGTVIDTRHIGMTSGDYQVVFETGFQGSSMWCRISAVLSGVMEPQILVVDGQLSPVFPLAMDGLEA